MSGKYQAYLNYKNAESEWLDSIPHHWNRAPLKYLVSIRITDGPHETPDFVDEGVPFLSAEAVKNNALDFGKKRGYIKRELHQIYSKKCLPMLDDIFMVKSGNTTGALAIVETEDEFNIWSPLALIRANTTRVLPRFVFYSMQAEFFQTSVQLSWSQGTQPNIGMGVIENLQIATPSLSEQSAIIDFLNHETAKIDNLIDKQQHLIKLLKEKRQAVINHAVTKGLNPDAPMKDSGVEWLEEVPKHWFVKRLARLFSESCARANSETELQYPLLSVSIHQGISDKELDESELDRKVSRSEDRSLYKIVRDNDLAYNMMRAWQGGFGASKLNGLISPAYVVCKPETKINSSYYELVLRSPNAVTELKRFSRGITDFRLRLYWDEFKNIRVPVPPVEEIDGILDHVKRVNSKYDQIADVAQRQIVLLQERRTALISAAVTGKIDVRNWQPARTEILTEANA
jgi:type I restriction enzyme, S subunit